MADSDFIRKEVQAQSPGRGVGANFGMGAIQRTGEAVEGFLTQAQQVATKLEALTTDSDLTGYNLHLKKAQQDYEKQTFGMRSDKDLDKAYDSYQKSLDSYINGKDIYGEANFRNAQGKALAGKESIRIKGEMKLALEKKKFENSISRSSEKYQGLKTDLELNPTQPNALEQYKINNGKMVQEGLLSHQQSAAENEKFEKRVLLANAQKGYAVFEMSNEDRARTTIKNIIDTHEDDSIPDDAKAEAIKNDFEYFEIEMKQQEALYRKAVANLPLNDYEKKTYLDKLDVLMNNVRSRVNSTLPRLKEAKAAVDNTNLLSYLNSPAYAEYLSPSAMTALGLSADVQISESKRKNLPIFSRIKNEQLSAESMVFSRNLHPGSSKEEVYAARVKALRINDPGLQKLAQDNITNMTSTTSPAMKELDDHFKLTRGNMLEAMLADNVIDADTTWGFGGLSEAQIKARTQVLQLNLEADMRRKVVNGELTVPEAIEEYNIKSTEIDTDDNKAHLRDLYSSRTTGAFETVEDAIVGGEEFKVLAPDEEINPGQTRLVEVMKDGNVVLKNPITGKTHAAQQTINGIDYFFDTETQTWKPILSPDAEGNVPFAEIDIPDEAQ